MEREMIDAAHALHTRECPQLAHEPLQEVCDIRVVRRKIRSRTGRHFRWEPDVHDDRAVPGHWEGDLILGEGGRSAVGTLIERTTRLLLLLHLQDGRSAVSVETAMREAIAKLPAELRRSITWDQGAEMSTHASFTTATGDPDLLLRSARSLAARLK